MRSFMSETKRQQSTAKNTFHFFSRKERHLKQAAEGRTQNATLAAAA
jgi:hypothetical protein